MYVSVFLIVAAAILLILGQNTYWSAKSASVLRDEIPAWVAYMLHLLMPGLAVFASAVSMNVENVFVKALLLGVAGLLVLAHYLAVLDIRREIKQVRPVLEELSAK